MSKRAPPYRNPVEAKQQAQSNARALDKMHIERMVKACVGVMVNFAFDDDQATRAAGWLFAKCSRSLGLDRDAAIALATRAIDAEHRDADGEKPTGLVSVQ